MLYYIMKELHFFFIETRFTTLDRTLCRDLLELVWDKLLPSFNAMEQLHLSIDIGTRYEINYP
jgi:hypothetical protein